MKTEQELKGKEMWKRLDSLYEDCLGKLQCQDVDTSDLDDYKDVIIAFMLATEQQAKQEMLKDEIDFTESELWHLENQSKNPKEFKISIENIKNRLKNLKSKLENNLFLAKKNVSEKERIIKEFKSSQERLKVFTENELQNRISGIKSKLEKK